MLHIDDLLEATYAEFQPAVPALAWEGIAGKLDQSNNRKGFVWWKAAAVVAVLSGIGALVYQQMGATSEQGTTNTVENAEKNPNSDLNSNGSDNNSNAPVVGCSENAAETAKDNTNVGSNASGR